MRCPTCGHNLKPPISARRLQAVASVLGAMEQGDKELDLEEAIELAERLAPGFRGYSTIQTARARGYLESVGSIASPSGHYRALYYPAADWRGRIAKLVEGVTTEALTNGVGPEAAQGGER